MKLPRLSLTALLLSVASIGAGAFTLEPISALLAPKGAGNVATFRIKNDGDERIAVRLRLLARDLSPEGKEINAPADELFLLYPARLVIQPGSTATAKVQYRGPASLASEGCYRLVAEQVALDAIGSKGKSSSIKVMFRYIASLYVGDAAFSPKLGAKATGAIGPDGQTGYLVELRNDGTRHVIAIDASLSLTREGARSPSREDIGELSGANYLPGRGRTAFVPGPEAIVGKAYDAQIDFESVY